jgi:Flp pilus assembly protein TadD
MGEFGMASTLLLVAALLAEGPATAITVEGSIDRIDVGYEELAAGRPEAAIARIKANKSLDSRDPSALINLGSAHARLGQADVARSYFRAAIASTTRYDLELASGKWMDSRRAAQLAETMLKDGQVLALR